MLSVALAQLGDAWAGDATRPVPATSARINRPDLIQFVMSFIVSTFRFRIQRRSTMILLLYHKKLYKSILKISNMVFWQKRPNQPTFFAV